MATEAVTPPPVEANRNANAKIADILTAAGKRRNWAPGRAERIKQLIGITVPHGSSATSVLPSGPNRPGPPLGRSSSMRAPSMRGMSVSGGEVEAGSRMRKVDSNQSLDLASSATIGLAAAVAGLQEADSPLTLSRKSLGSITTPSSPMINWMGNLGSPVSSRPQPPWFSASNIRVPSLGEVPMMSKQSSLERQRFARVADMAVQVEARLATAGAAEGRRGGGALTESPPALLPAAVQNPQIEGYLMSSQNNNGQAGAKSHSGVLMRSMDKSSPQQPPATAAAHFQPQPAGFTPAQAAAQQTGLDPDPAVQKAKAIKPLANQLQQGSMGSSGHPAQLEVLEQAIAHNKVLDAGQAGDGSEQGLRSFTVQPSQLGDQAAEPRESVGGDQGPPSSGSPQRVLRSELRGSASRVRWAPDVQEAELTAAPPVDVHEGQKDAQVRSDKVETQSKKWSSTPGRVRRQMSRLGPSASASGCDASLGLLEGISRSGSDASVVLMRRRTSGGIVGGEVSDDEDEAVRDTLTRRQPSMVQRTLSRINSRTVGGMSPVTLAAHLLSTDALSLQLGPSRANSFRSVRSSMSQTRRAYLPDQAVSPTGKQVGDASHLPAGSPTHAAASTDGHLPSGSHVTTAGPDSMYSVPAATASTPSSHQHLHQKPDGHATEQHLHFPTQPLELTNTFNHHPLSNEEHPQQPGQPAHAATDRESRLSRPLESPSILRRLKLWLTRVTGPRHIRQHSSTSAVVPHPPASSGRRRTSAVVPTAQQDNGMNMASAEPSDVPAGSSSINSQRNQAMHVGAGSETRAAVETFADHLQHGARSISIHYSEPARPAAQSSWSQAPLQTSHTFTGGTALSPTHRTSSGVGNDSVRFSNLHRLKERLRAERLAAAGQPEHPHPGAGREPESGPLSQTGGFASRPSINGRLGVLEPSVAQQLVASHGLHPHPPPPVDLGRAESLGRVIGHAGGCRSSGTIGVASAGPRYLSSSGRFFSEHSMKEGQVSANATSGKGTAEVSFATAAPGATQQGAQ